MYQWMDQHPRQTNEYILCQHHGDNVLIVIIHLCIYLRQIYFCFHTFTLTFLPPTFARCYPDLLSFYCLTVFLFKTSINPTFSSWFSQSLCLFLARKVFLDFLTKQTDWFVAFPAFIPYMLTKVALKDSRVHKFMTSRSVKAESCRSLQKITLPCEYLFPGKRHQN